MSLLSPRFILKIIKSRVRKRNLQKYFAILSKGGYDSSDDPRQELTGGAKREKERDLTGRYWADGRAER